VGKSTVETLAGMALVALVVCFGFYAYASFQTHNGNVHGYSLKARFNSADGITTGTDVTLNGVKIGTVSSVGLDPKTYIPTVYISIRRDIHLPDDSAVKLTSSGLLGDSYLAIQVGSSSKMLAAGASIKTAPGGAGLADLIDHLANGKTGSK
jgi:phospholipid/cholesterol/gamma-HCH transport system substrate-binding protein